MITFPTQFVRLSSPFDKFTLSSFRSADHDLDQLP
jgi:hypothetical protein